MTAGELMTRRFESVHADATLEDVARKLQAPGLNLLPVTRDGYLVGTITRDEVALTPRPRRRAEPVRVGDVIAPDLLFCFENTDVSEAASLMRENRVNLLPVLGPNKALVGVLALDDIPEEPTVRAAGPAGESV
jgi:CBS domain-containing protein